MRNALALVAALVAAPLLSGCFGMAAAGLGASVMIAGDRRTTGVYIEDENIEWKVLALVRERFPSAHVNATSYNRRLLLTGEISDEGARTALAEAARGIASVREVITEATVGTNSTITARGNDTLITSNVKARMLGNGKFSPNHVKVVTEAGVVFLLGLVTEAEGDAAVEIARGTAGVTRVVKVFEYVKPS